MAEKSEKKEGKRFKKKNNNPNVIKPDDNDWGWTI